MGRPQNVFGSLEVLLNEDVTTSHRSVCLQQALRNDSHMLPSLHHLHSTVGYPNGAHWGPTVPQSLTRAMIRLNSWSGYAMRVTFS